MPRSEDRPILLCSAGVEAGGPGVGATGGGQPGPRPPQHGFLVVLVILHFLHKNHRMSCADCTCDGRVSLESRRICFNLYVADAATLLGTQWIVALLAGLCEYYAVQSPEVLRAVGVAVAAGLPRAAGWCGPRSLVPCTQPPTLA